MERRPARRARSVHSAARPEEEEGPFGSSGGRAGVHAEPSTCSRRLVERALFFPPDRQGRALPPSRPLEPAPPRPRAPDFGLDVTLTSFAQRGP